MNDWFPLFLNLFAMGTGASLLAVPYKQIGKYYFTFHSTILLVMVAVAALVGKPWQGVAQGSAYMRVVAGLSILFPLLVLVQNFLVRAAKDELRSDALILPVLTGVVYVIMACFGWTEYGTGAAVLLVFHLLSSAMVLGTSLVAMSTGHWYLANAALSFDLLIRLCRMFVIAIVAKAAIVLLYAGLRFEDYWRLEDFYMIIMGTRFFGGVVLAVVLALMSLSCAKRHANQSATGVLYVAVVFVLIGETMSLWLTSKNLPF